MSQDSGMPLRTLFAQYELKRLRGKSCGTAGQYYTAIENLERFLQRDATTDDLFDERIQSYMHAEVERRGISIDTAVSYTKKLLSLWRFGCRHGLIQTWPEVELLTCPEREPVAWTEHEIRLIFAALRSQEGFIGPAPANLFWPALLLCFWDSAERLGSVLMLRVEDVNLNAAWMVFRAETRKGKLRDRGMPMHAQTVEAIHMLLAIGVKRRLVFEAPFGEQTLRDRYKTILKGAGLPHDRKRLFHCVRRTVASHFEAAGYSAQELLDHSTREVTQRYLSPQIVRPPRPADVLFRPE